ncbi:MAG: tetratricopeptide repeat protein [Actinomycetota bacterium]|nr:tetratricopeptide repeat protein [Actinomycetota bacterium]MDA8074907.1 tetratricopeptide repeat protein [Actinomycetota bacterium]
MARPDLDTVLRLKRAGDLDGAVIALESALGSHAHPAALVQLADIQLHRGRFDEAEEALERAEAEAGTTAATARLRAELAYRTGRFADAARCYEQAAALGDQSSWTLVQLGRSRLRLGDLRGARSAAARAIERDDAASAWALLGDVERRQGHLEEAETMYANAHQRAPADQWAHAKLVEVRLLRLPPERRAKEMAVLRKTAAADNSHLTAVLARLRSEEGDHVAAASAWGERAERTGDLYARKMRGFALRRAGQLPEAAAVLGACLLDDPHDLVLFRTYVHLQRKRGALDELRRTLEGLLPYAGSRRGAVYGELRKLPAAPAGGEAGPAAAGAEQPTTAGEPGPTTAGVEQSIPPGEPRPAAAGEPGPIATGEPRWGTAGEPGPAAGEPGPAAADAAGRSGRGGRGRQAGRADGAGGS